jgi:hypothetical protein
MMQMAWPKPSFNNLSLLFIAALILRAGLFYFYVQHNERYRQPDSTDYHTAALVLSYSGTMTRFDNNEPIFWRTPGYPVFLWPFYTLQGLTTGKFSDYVTAQKAAIWLQIILCSFIPIILLFLALQLTGSLIVAWITALFSAIHLGFALAATYLLTDGLASLFFYLFLLFFYKAFRMRGDTDQKKATLYWFLVAAVLNLSIYTWMRPMGTFVGILCTVLLLFSLGSWQKKIKISLFFFTLFFSTLSPWYIRNYNLTGQWFFCPMSGAYIQAFCAPKIIRRVSGWPLEKCMRSLFIQVEQEAKKEGEALRAQGSRNVVVKHIICGKVAWPWLTAYPLQASYDWIVQVFKTGFDLYASQLVAFAYNTFSYDPLEEYLGERISSALYAKPLPYWMRIAAWFELVTSIVMWLGLLAGSLVFLLQPLYLFVRYQQPWSRLTALWLKTTPLIGAIIFMTGGFGYARLRLPVEPLMIILALTFFVLREKSSKKKSPQ